MNSKFVLMGASSILVAATVYGIHRYRTPPQVSVRPSVAEATPATTQTVAHRATSASPAPEAMSVAPSVDSVQATSAAAEQAGPTAAPTAVATTASILSPNSVATTQTVGVVSQDFWFGLRDGQKTVLLHYFFEIDCNTCLEIEPFLARMESMYPWLEIRYHQLGAASGAEYLLWKVRGSLKNQTIRMPAILFCERVQPMFSDAAKVGAAIEAALKACHEKSLETKTSS